MNPGSHKRFCRAAICSAMIIIGNPKMAEMPGMGMGREGGWRFGSRTRGVAFLEKRRREFLSDFTKALTTE
jgi:hypothetical protein